MRQLDLSLAFLNEPEPLDFVFCGLVGGTVGNIASPGATGKSFMAMELAMSVASLNADEQLLKFGIQKSGKAAIFNAEDPDVVLNSRVHSIGKYLEGSAKEEVFQNLQIHPLLGQQPDITDTAFLNSVIKLCKDHRLLIFDTFTRFHKFNENDNGQMSQVVSCYEKIAVETGAAVLFLHHSSKGAVLSGQQVEQQSTRGASSITDNCRWQGFLQTMTAEEAAKLGVIDKQRKKYVRFGGNKENYGLATADKWLERGVGGVLIPAPKFEEKAPLKLVKAGSKRNEEV